MKGQTWLIIGVVVIGGFLFLRHWAKRTLGLVLNDVYMVCPSCKSNANSPMCQQCLMMHKAVLDMDLKRDIHFP